MRAEDLKQAELVPEPDISFRIPERKAGQCYWYTIPPKSRMIVNNTPFVVGKLQHRRSMGQLHSYRESGGGNTSMASSLGYHDRTDSAAYTAGGMSAWDESGAPSGANTMRQYANAVATANTGASASAGASAGIQSSGRLPNVGPNSAVSTPRSVTPVGSEVSVEWGEGVGGQTLGIGGKQAALSMLPQMPVTTVPKRRPLQDMPRGTPARALTRTRSSDGLSVVSRPATLNT
eukprot:GFYU01025974.1.p1 GENE.GFYU01025974.1~~GFYU01025974.1.p1  ORF type:complete len:233 (+),score=41.84 GFYU01025974.1:3-701(+)